MGGHISKEFTVWCSDCNEWHQVSAKNERIAIVDFKSNGWRKIKITGWVCKPCFNKLIGQ